MGPKELKEYVIDCEADSLNPTIIHCLSVHTKSGLFTTTDYSQMRKALLGADVIVGHNIVRFDIPHLERLLGIKITARLVDTLALSWYLQPKRKSHNLEDYGDDFGVEKPKIDDWKNLKIEDYIHRCEQDVRINTHLWNAQFSKLEKIYTETKLWEFIDYLAFKMRCIHLQEKSKWKLDIEFTKESLDSLEKLKEEKTDQLAAVMPRVPVRVKKVPPKVLYKKDGTLSSHGTAWFNLLTERSLPSDTQEVEIITRYNEPNPSSGDQIKAWLYSLGWKPQTWKTNKKGKEVEQVSLPFGKGLCDSVKDLFDDEPRLKVLDGLSVLGHRIGLLKGFLKEQENGYVTATVSGLTNTLRFQHMAPCVNLPKPDKLYAGAIRAALTCEKDEELCGADMASLEDRLKQHYIFPLDPDYVKDMMKDDFDPHIDLAIIAGKLSQEDKELYQWYEGLSDEEKKTVGDNTTKAVKTVKAIRSIFKNGNYACQYGAGATRLTVTCGIDMREAKALHKTYWKRNWAIKEVSQGLIVKDGPAHGEDSQGKPLTKWLYNPVSGFYYSLRNEKDRFSTLVQGTAAYVFDLWVGYVVDKRPQLTAQFHDEIVLRVKKGHRESIIKYLTNTINQTNNKLKLNRQLDIGIQFGQCYADIH